MSAIEYYKLNLGKDFWEFFEEYHDCTKKEFAARVQSLIAKHGCKDWAKCCLKSKGRFDTISIKASHIIEQCFEPEISKTIEHLRHMLEEVKALKVRFTTIFFVHFNLFNCVSMFPVD